MNKQFSLKKRFISVNIICTLIVMVSFYLVIYEFHHQARDNTLHSILSDAISEHGTKNVASSGSVGIITSRNWNDMPILLLKSFGETPPVPGQLYKERVKHDEDSSSMYFFMASEDDQGIIYSSKKLNWENFKPSLNNFKLNTYTWIVLIIALVGAIYSLMLFVSTMLLVNPIEKIISWRNSASDLSISKPKFRYEELNNVVDIICEEMKGQRKLVEDERKLLQFISHELRAPVASLRSNTDLLMRLLNDDPRSLRATNRLSSSILEISELIETILAMDSNNDERIVSREVLLSETVSYLTVSIGDYYSGRETELSFVHDNTPHILPVSAVKIVVSNVIRNAFQHSSNESKVKIDYKDGILMVKNMVGVKQQNTVNTGYGLGLQLTKRICDNLDWKYTSEEKGGAYAVFIDFNLPVISDLDE